VLSGVLACELEIAGVVDFRPWQAPGRGRANVNALVRQLLDGRIEEIVHAAGSNQGLHSTEEPAVNRGGERRDPQVGPAELLSRDALAHAHDFPVLDDHLHGFVTPFRIDDHCYWPMRFERGHQNPSVEHHVGIQTHERVVHQPVTS